MDNIENVKATEEVIKEGAQVAEKVVEHANKAGFNAGAIALGAAATLGVVAICIGAKKLIVSTIEKSKEKKAKVPESEPETEATE